MNEFFADAESKGLYDQAPMRFAKPFGSRGKIETEPEGRPSRLLQPTARGSRHWSSESQGSVSRQRVRRRSEFDVLLA
jgi:hypothetical protein